MKIEFEGRQQKTGSPIERERETDREHLVLKDLLTEDWKGGGGGNINIFLLLLNIITICKQTTRENHSMQSIKMIMNWQS